MFDLERGSAPSCMQSLLAAAERQNINGRCACRREAGVDSIKQQGSSQAHCAETSSGRLSCLYRHMCGVVMTACHQDPYSNSNSR